MMNKEKPAPAQDEEVEQESEEEKVEDAEQPEEKKANHLPMCIGGVAAIMGAAVMAAKYIKN